MVAGVIFFALGLKKTLGEPDDALKIVPDVALLGGVALYLLALVAFRYRHVHSINRRRLTLAIVLVALIPAALELPAMAMLAVIGVLVWTLIVIETRSYGRSPAGAPRRPRPRRPLTGVNRVIRGCAAGARPVS